MIVRSFDPDQPENPWLDFYFYSLFVDAARYPGWYRQTRVVL